MKNKNRIKNLEKAIGAVTEDEFVVLPSHLENQVKLPPNTKVLFCTIEALEKYRIEWRKYYERFKI